MTVHTATLERLFEIDTWREQANPLGEWVRVFDRAMAPPLIGPISLLQSRMDACLAWLRDELLRAYKAKYPAMDLDSLWAAMDKNIKPMPVVASMPQHQLKEFINLTYWCASAEGTARRGKVTLHRMSLAVGHENASEIAKFISPLRFTSPCPCCQHEAAVTALSALMTNADRPLTMRCPNCLHVETPVRQPQLKGYLHGRPDRYENRLRCQCQTCKQRKSDVVAYAARTLDPALKRVAEAVADASEKCIFSMMRSLYRKGGAHKDYYIDRDAHPTLSGIYDKLDRLVFERAVPMQDAVWDTIYDSWSEFGGAINVVNYGLIHGRIRLVGYEYPEDHEAALEAVVANLGLYSATDRIGLSELRAALRDGNPVRVAKAVKALTRDFLSLYPRSPLTITVALERATSHAVAGGAAEHHSPGGRWLPGVMPAWLREGRDKSLARRVRRPAREAVAQREC